MDTTNAIYAYGKAVEKLGEWYMEYARARCLKNNEELIFKLQCKYEVLNREVKIRKRRLSDLLDLDV